MSEKWLIIKGYPNYEVSNWGNVRSIRRNKILKGCENDSGYLYVNLIHNKIIKTTAIHKLVIEHFGDKKPDVDYVVDHIDKNKTNNKIDNLQWVTITENTLRFYGNDDKKKEIMELRESGLTIQKISNIVGLSLYTVQQHIHRSKTP